MRPWFLWVSWCKRRSKLFEHEFHLLAPLFCLFREKQQAGDSILFVYFGLIFDIFGPEAKSQRRNGLSRIVSTGRNVDNKTNFTINAQILLEKPSQSGVAIGNMATFSLCKRFDDVSHTRQ